MKSLRDWLPHYGYAIIGCCFLIMSVNVGLVMSSAGIFYQPVSRELGVSAGSFGLYMSFNYLASTLTLYAAGHLLDKFSARLLLTLSSAVLGLTLLGMAIAAALWQFYLAGALIGVTMAFLLYLSFPTMVNRWFKGRVGFFMGLCSAASGVGGIVFNPLGAYLITHYGWRAAYGCFGAVVLLLVTPLLGLLLRNYPQDVGQEPCGTEQVSQRAAGSSGTAYSIAIRQPVFYSLLVFAFLMVAVSTLNLFIPNYLNSLGYSLEQASWGAAAVMLGVTMGKIVLGIINDYNNLLGLAVTILCGIVGLALLLTGKLGLAAVLAGAFLFGWAYAGVTVQTPLLVRTVFGSRDYSKIYAKISMAFAVGGALTAGGWGLVADYFSFGFILALGMGFLLICGLLGWLALHYGQRQKITAK